MISSLIYLFPTLFILVGIIFLTIGIFLASRQRRLEILCKEPVFAKVTDIIRRAHTRHSISNGTSHSLSWSPVFEYDVGEQHFKKISTYSSSELKYSIGQDVKLYCNPNNFNEYIVAGEKGPRKLALIFILLGILLFIIGVFSIPFFLISFNI